MSQAVISNRKTTRASLENNQPFPQWTSLDTYRDPSHLGRMPRPRIFCLVQLRVCPTAPGLFIRTHLTREGCHHHEFSACCSFVSVRQHQKYSWGPCSPGKDATTSNFLPAAASWVFDNTRSMIDCRRSTGKDKEHSLKHNIHLNGVNGANTEMSNLR